MIQTTNGKKKLPRVIDGKTLKQLTPLKSTQSNQQPTMRFVPSKLTGSSSVRVKPKGTPLITNLFYKIFLINPNSMHEIGRCPQTRVTQ